METQYKIPMRCPHLVEGRVGTLFSAQNLDSFKKEWEKMTLMVLQLNFNNGPDTYYFIKKNCHMILYKVI